MLVKPHRLKSREVTDADYKRVVEEVSAMAELFAKAPNCVALAHPQVNDKDPLRLYVLRDGMAIINPRIERHSNYKVESVEGCMTFGGEKPVTKMRYRKVEVSFQGFSQGKLTERQVAKLTGFMSFVAQHEIDHLDGIYCYDGTGTYLNDGNLSRCCNGRMIGGVQCEVCGSNGDQN